MRWRSCRSYYMTVRYQTAGRRDDIKRLWILGSSHIMVPPGKGGASENLQADELKMKVW